MSPAAVGVVGLLLAGCGGGTDLLLPGDGEVANIEVEHGNGQSGRVGEELALIFKVTDAGGRPVNGARVAFELTSAGPGAAVEPDTGQTRPDGRTDATMVLGTTIGPQAGEARVVVPDGSRQPKTTFTVMALPENANGIDAVAGDDQTGAAGSPLSLPLVVRVTDVFGNPVTGAPISWAVEGGGSVSEASNTTDEDGQASVQRILGSVAGPQSTLASSQDLAGSPVTFHHTATAGNPSGLSIVSGNDQTARAGTELPGDLVVRLVDGGGNGVVGAAVTWVVGTGGGTVSPQNTTTDEAGRTSARWTLGRNPGENRVDAVVSGVGVVHFRATGTAAAPAALSIAVQPSASARNGAVLERQPVVQVRDASGNPAATSGVAITASLAGGGGELLGTRQRSTDASGRAFFTDLGIAGAEGTRTLVFTATGYAGATSSPIDVRAIATTTTITSDSPDPSVAGSPVTVGFQVTSEGPIPTGSVTVTVSDGGATCSGSLQNGAGSCQLFLNRSGDRTLRATYAGSPGFNGSSGTASHRVDVASPDNQPPDADYNFHCEGLTCDFTDRSSDRDGRVVAWSWNFGDGSPAAPLQNPTHTYAGPGEYTVTLTATDDRGASDASSAEVEVEAPPPPPPGGTNTTITADTPDPSDPGQSVTVSFTVTSSSGSPTGPVNVTDERGGSCTGQAPSGSCTYVPAGTGTRTITATYQGNSDFNESSAAAQHTVTEPPPPPANTSTTITGDGPDPSDFGVPITVSFTVTSAGGTPSGDVQVTDAVGGGCSGSVAAGSCGYTPTGSGPRTITARYGGNSSFNPSEDTEGHTVNAPPPTNTSTTITGDGPDPSDFGVPITVSFTVTSSAGTPSGDVQVTDAIGGGCNASVAAGSCSYTPAGSGQRNVTARYGGNSGFNPSQDTEGHTVNAPPPATTTTTITGDGPDPSDFGVPITVSFTVTSAGGTPTGDVQVTDAIGGGCNASVAAGSCSYTPAGSGQRNVTARYGGNSSFSPSQDVVAHSVNEPPPSNAPPTALIGSISCADLSCTFTDASTDPDGSETIENWSWEFGDGGSSNLRNPTYDYPAAGDYRVTLTVTDDHNATDTIGQDLTVLPPSGGVRRPGALIARSRQS